MLSRPRLQSRNALTDGLVFAVAGGYPFDLVSGRKGTPSGPVTTWDGVSFYGGAFESTVTNGTQRISWPDALVSRIITTRQTVVFGAHLDALTSSWQGVSIPYSGALSSPFQSMGFTGGGTGTGGLIRMTIGGGHNFKDFAAPYFITGESHVYAWTRSAATNTVYRDGVLYGTDGTLATGAIDFSGAGTEIVINGFSTSVAFESPDGRMAFALIWARVLTSSEIAPLSLDPAQIWAPRATPFPPILLPHIAAAGVADDNRGWTVL